MKDYVMENPPSDEIESERWRDMVKSVKIHGENPDAKYHT